VISLQLLLVRESRAFEAAQAEVVRGVPVILHHSCYCLNCVLFSTCDLWDVYTHIYFPLLGTSLMPARFDITEASGATKGYVYLLNLHSDGGRAAAQLVGRDLF